MHDNTLSSMTVHDPAELIRNKRGALGCMMALFFSGKQMVKLGLSNAFEDIRRLHWFSRKQRPKEPHSPEYLTINEESICSAAYPNSSNYSWIQSTPPEKTLYDWEYLRSLGPPTGATLTPQAPRPRYNPYAPSTPSPLSQHSRSVQQPIFSRPVQCSPARSPLSPAASTGSLPLTAETCSYIEKVVKTQVAQMMGKLVDENLSSCSEVSCVETDIEALRPSPRERPQPIFFRPDYSPPASSESNNSLNLDRMPSIKEVSDEESFCDCDDKLSDAVVSSTESGKTTPEPEEAEENAKMPKKVSLNWEMIARTATQSDLAMKRFSIPAWMDSSRCLERLKQNLEDTGNTGPQANSIKV